MHSAKNTDKKLRSGVLMKPKIIRYLFFFLLGSVIYPCIELIWRGHSHISMAVLGGLATISIVWLDSCLKRGLFLQKAFLSAVIITQLEWVFGVVLNLQLKMEIWDYSDLPFHLAGQICPLFSFYWFLLSLFLIILLDIEKGMKKQKLSAKH